MDELYDGKPEVLAFLRGFHPRERIFLASLEPGNPRPWPRGWTYTNNPQHLNTVGKDLSRGVLFSPTSDRGLPLTVYASDGEPYILAQDLGWVMMLLLEQGPPLLTRYPMALWQYTLGQIEQCPSFLVPEPAPRTRRENELHIDSCDQCQPVSKAMAASISAGSTAYKDDDVRRMIEMSHDDQAAAIAFYERRQAGHAMGTTAASTPKPSRRKVAAEVTA